MLQGDRWVCMRAESAGGPCSEGPFPDGRCAHPRERCVPTLSRRAARARVAKWALLVTLGAVLVVLAPNRRATWVSPGPVSQAHGEIASCDGCHPAFSAGVTGWLGQSIEARTPQEAGAPCLACHRLGDQPFSAHGQPFGVLETRRAVSEARRDATSDPLRLAVAGAVFPVSAADPVGCAVCHREHQGENARLGRISDDRCQSCHSEQFESFANGHPEFESYPANRRTHLVFDHVRHIARHFASRTDVVAPTTCGGCHESDLFGRRMLVKPFAESCASCHLSQIDGRARTAGTTALAVLTVPGMDLQTLAAQGFDVGEWPRFAEEEITPLLHLLLFGDREVRDDLWRTMQVEDLLDLRDASPEVLGSVARVAWAVKELMFDVMVSGSEALGARLEATTGQRLERAALVELLGALPRDVVTAAQEEWFPDLLTEVPRYRAGEIVVAGHRELPAVGAGSPAAEVTSPVRDERDASPNLLAEDAEDHGSPAGDDELLGGDDRLLAEDDHLLAGDDELLMGDEELWGGDGSDELLGAGGDDEDLFAFADDLTDASAADGDAGADALVELPTVDPEQWAALGGWYRANYSLYYRPVGHADRFLRTWLDVLAATFGTSAERVARPVFRALTDPQAPGSCAKCHSIDARPDGGRVVNWQPTRVTAGTTELTMFQHVSHFSVTDQEGCLSCHALNADARPLDYYTGTDPTSYASSFADISKSHCEGCHVSGAAGDACTQCHGYHVGVAHTSTLSTRLRR